jgi:hypothetical protein
MAGMTVDLFAGIPVTDDPAALVWYEKLLGSHRDADGNEIGYGGAPL